MILGALVGDYIGSYYEWKKHRTKDYNFDLFHDEDRFTDDSILTIAIIDGLLEYKAKDNKCLEELSIIIKNKLLEWGNAPEYCEMGFGAGFLRWLTNPVPYGSVGNGAAMRISGISYFAETEDEVKQYSKIVTDVTHNSEQAERAAECVAMCVFKLIHGATKQEIIELAKIYYPLIMGLNLDELRPHYKMNITCDGSVPVAIKAFIDSKDFEDALRIAISMGGDADTLGSICGALAGVYYGIPKQIESVVKGRLDDRFKSVLSLLDSYCSVLRVEKDCFLELDGTCNTRHIVSKNAVKLLRSDNLNYLSNKDVDKLYKLGYKTVIDLRPERDDFDFIIKRDSRFNYLNIPFDMEKAEKHTKENGKTFYLNLLLQYDVVCSVFKTICEAKEGVIICCSHGKDRTGVISFLLLETLGIDREFILNDYCISSYCIYKGQENNKENIKIEKIPSTKKKYFIRFLNQFDFEYQNIYNYLRLCNLEQEEVKKSLNRKDNK